MSIFKTKVIRKGNTMSSMNHISEHQTEKQQPKKRNKFRIFTGILLIFSSIFFFGIIGLKALGNVPISALSEEFKKFTPILEVVTDENSETNTTKNTQPEIKNILLTGIGGQGHQAGGENLTDSIILAQLNYSTKSVTMLSIPRDFYVAKSAHTAGKINELYENGLQKKEGINLLAKKVSEITGQPIHHYAVIDFKGFKKVIDALGGIEVDVPKNLYEPRYPGPNWTWTTFSVKKGLQKFDGETALKYARARYSTSDNDRSERQQLLIRAIKDKALSLGVLTNPSKISELVDSVRNHINTDLTIGEMSEIALHFKDINNKSILTYLYHHECEATSCPPGKLLKHLNVPSGDKFIWTVIPQEASLSRLSKYEKTRQFAELIFAHPQLKNQEKNIQIIASAGQSSKARQLKIHLEEMGLPVDHTNSIIPIKETIEKTKIIAYYNPQNKTGFDENHVIIEALKQLDSNIEIEYLPHNLYTKEATPKIEIILGKDFKKQFGL